MMMMDLKGSEDGIDGMSRGSFLEEVGLVDKLVAVCPKCSFSISFVTPPPSILTHCKKCGQLVSLPRMNPMSCIRRVREVTSSATMRRRKHNTLPARDTRPTRLSERKDDRCSDSTKASPTKEEISFDAHSGDDDKNSAVSLAKKEKYQKFLEAIRNNTTIEVRRLLQENLNPNIADETPVASYPIHWAACSDRNGSHMDVFEEILNNKKNLVDLNVKNKKGQTAAMLAAASGNIRVLQILRAAGANFLIRTEQGFNVVHFASQNGHTLLLDFFVRSCHMSLEELDKDGRTALHWAVYNGHRRTVEWLLKVGNCDIMSVDDEQCMPIHWAALQGNYKMVEVLLKHGDVLKQLRSKDCTGKTPYSLAHEKAGRVDGQKSKIFKRLARFLKETEATTTKYTRCGVKKMVDWSCMGGLGGYFFWFLAIFEWSVSYYLYLSDGMIGTTGHRWMSTLMFMIGSVWQVSSWYLTVSSDPGYVLDKKNKKKISPKNRPVAAWNVLKDLYKDALTDVAVTELSLDESDGIVRPLRSKHCAASGLTVLRFDHFCPWMNNCIGGRNYIWFVSFLTATVFLSLSWIILGCTHLRVTYPKYTSLWQCVKADPFRAFWYLHYGLYFVYSILLSQQHFYLIAVNLTTNEQINKRRYDYLKDSTGSFFNPFDQGPMKNFIDFLRRSEQTALPPRKVMELTDDGHV